MTNNQPERETDPAVKLTNAESAALDAMIVEAVTGKTPPNFVEPVLKRLQVERAGGDAGNTNNVNINAANANAGNADAGNTVASDLDVYITPVSRADHRSARRRRRRSRWIAAVGTAVAASLLAFLWKPGLLNPGSQQRSPDASIVSNDAELSGGGPHPLQPLVAPESGFDAGVAANLTKPDPPTSVAASDSSLESSIATLDENLAGEQRGVSGLANDRFASDDANMGSMVLSPGGIDSGSLQDPEEFVEVDRSRDHLLKRRALPVKLVSKRIDRDLQSYWNAAGVQPTANAGGPEVVARLSDALGVRVPVSALENHQSVSAWLRGQKVSAEISRTWLQQVTGGGLSKIPAKMQNRLTWGVAHRFRNTSPFDAYLIGLLRGQNELSSAFFTAMLSDDNDPGGVPSTSDPDLVANVAALTMNVDVSCTRCHDSMVGHGHGIQDYWGFAAVLGSGLQSSGGKLKRVDSGSSKPTFYEDKDRRGQVAEPAISPRWMLTEAADDPGSGLNSMGAWALALRGSRPLAGGIVNSLWELVHGRPLRGVVAHPMTAPMSDELVKLESDLVEDLIRSGFDINRTLSLILMSPTTRRTTPESLRDVWATDHSDAHRKAIVFAGAVPMSKPVAVSVKARQSMIAIGGLGMTRGDQLRGQQLLGQLGDVDRNANPKSAGKPSNASPTLPWDFPDSADAMPVPWLASVKGLQAKVKHLCYLAGHDRVPPVIAKAFRAMQNAGVDEATLLHRVWWIAQGR